MNTESTFTCPHCQHRAVLTRTPVADDRTTHGTDVLDLRCTSCGRVLLSWLMIEGRTVRQLYPPRDPIAYERVRLHTSTHAPHRSRQHGDRKVT